MTWRICWACRRSLSFHLPTGSIHPRRRARECSGRDRCRSSVQSRKTSKKGRLGMSRIHDALKQMDITREPEISRSPLPNMRDVEDVPAIPSLLTSACETAWEFDPAFALSFDDPSPKAAEEFRSLRLRFQQIREKQPLRSVVVTSALAGEGKSF